MSLCGPLVPAWIRLWRRQLGLIDWCMGLGCSILRCVSSRRLCSGDVGLGGLVYYGVGFVDGLTGCGEVLDLDLEFRVGDAGYY